MALRILVVAGNHRQATDYAHRDAFENDRNVRDYASVTTPRAANDQTRNVKPEDARYVVVGSIPRDFAEIMDLIHARGIQRL